MYNSFIRKKHLADQEEKIHRDQKVKQWKKRYQTEVQPQMLEHYEKRIASFIQNLEENPIIVNSQPPKTIDHRNNFVYKRVQDWKSLFNLRERLQKVQNKNWLSKHNINEQHFNKCQSNQSSPIKQFRQRIKSKEIQPPMKHQKKNSQKTLEAHKPKRLSLKQVAQQKQKKRQKLSELTFKDLKRTNTITLNLLTNNSSVSSTSKNQQEDQNNLLNNLPNDFIQIQAKKYEKQRQVKDKKRHFKKLLDLSLTNENETQRQQIKTILKKCGYLNSKRLSGQAEASQMLDKLTSLIEKGQK